jgi:protein O-GlcNAc transferase
MSDKTKPYEAGTWYDLGVALLAEERSKEALAAFTEASAIDPHYPLLQNKIVTALIGLGHYIKALQIGENLVRDRPKDATAWATLALSASCCRKWDRSLTAAQRAFKLKYLVRSSRL